MKVSNLRIIAILEERIRDLIAKQHNPERAAEIQAYQDLLDLMRSIKENNLNLREVIATFRSTRRPLPGEQQTLGL